MARLPKAKIAARKEKKRKRFEAATPEDRTANGWTICAPRKQVVDGVEMETNVLRRARTMVNVTKYGITFRVPKFKRVPVWPE